MLPAAQLCAAGFFCWEGEKKFKKICGFVQHTGNSVCLCICKCPKLSSFWIAVLTAALLNVLISWFCIRLTNCLAEKESRFRDSFYFYYLQDLREHVLDGRIDTRD